MMVFVMVTFLYLSTFSALEQLERNTLNNKDDEATNHTNSQWDYHPINIFHGVHHIFVSFYVWFLHSTWGQAIWGIGNTILNLFVNEAHLISQVDEIICIIQVGTSLLQNKYVDEGLWTWWGSG